MKIKTIIDWLNSNNYKFEFIGEDSDEILTFSSLNNYKKNAITWIKKVENINSINLSCIQCAVIQSGINISVKNKIVTSNSKEVFFAILHQFWGTSVVDGFVGQGTYIDENAFVHPTACIGYNCSILGNVTIGAHTVIENNVSIFHSVKIGESCLIHSGAVIGADGFGFAFDKYGSPIKVEHFGGVDIGNHVEIGANTCIDRGTIDNTIIGDNVKIDNLVHIAHNSNIGKGAMVVAGAIVCGSARLGEDSYIAPGGIVKNQLEVGANSFVGLGAVVTKNVDDNVVVTGVPAKVIRKVKKGDK